MFLLRRPDRASIERFLCESRDLPLSYNPIGIVKTRPRHELDEAVVVVGRGRADFERARDALVAWRQFEIGWVELFPQGASVEPGTIVAVLIRHFGFWSLNGCRVVYRVGEDDPDARFGYAYGTLTNHAEAGEEIFEVCFDRETGDVKYRIRAISWPNAWLTRIGQPMVRVLQRRFRRDSSAAMRQVR